MDITQIRTNIVNVLWQRYVRSEKNGGVDDGYLSDDETMMSASCPFSVDTPQTASQHWPCPADFLYRLSGCCCEFVCVCFMLERYKSLHSGGQDLFGSVFYSAVCKTLRLH